MSDKECGSKSQGCPYMRRVLHAVLGAAFCLTGHQILHDGGSPCFPLSFHGQAKNF